MRPSLVLCLVLVAACGGDTTPRAPLPLYAPNPYSFDATGVNEVIGIDVEPNTVPYLVGPNWTARSAEEVTKLRRELLCVLVAPILAAFVVAALRRAPQPPSA